MRYLKAFFLLFASLFILAIGFSFFLPAKHEIVREQEIMASKSELFELINSPKNWELWMPQDTSLSKEVSIVYTGPESGEGSKVSLRGPGSDVSFEITTSIIDSLVAYEMTIHEAPILLYGSIRIDSLLTGGNKVFITDVMDLGNDVLYKYFGIVAAKNAGLELEESLQKLKHIAESKP